ncbi:MAG TPA: hypothetical protein DCR93_36805 [Cytophagales bacterium]|nr:hypothetical protein [Cytophagales bacterium]HAP64816.1 hypothetical protein [Cytophagales bacterium]
MSNPRVFFKWVGEYDPRDPNSKPDFWDVDILIWVPSFHKLTPVRPDDIAHRNDRIEVELIFASTIRPWGEFTHLKNGGQPFRIKNKSDYQGPRDGVRGPNDHLIRVWWQDSHLLAEFQNLGASDYFDQGHSSGSSETHYPDPPS